MRKVTVVLCFCLVGRCRKLYAKYLETMPTNCEAWNAFADMEKTVGETDRARAIYELAISQPALDMPETLWKAYIDFEIGEEEVGRVRELYERLLERTSHVKVWISFGQFEAENGGGIEVSVVAAWQVGNCAHHTIGSP